MQKVTGRAWWLAIGLLCFAPTAAAQFEITKLSPSSVPVGSGDFTLGITFANPAVGGGTPVYSVTFDGVFLSGVVQTGANTLTVTVPGSYILAPGVVPVEVGQNVGGTTLFTPAVNFTITPPTITSFSPPFAVVGQGAFTLTVNGSGFYTITETDVISPTFIIGTLQLPTTVINNTQLQVNIPASIDAAAQVYNNVELVGPGEEESNVVSYQVVLSTLAIATTQMPVATVNVPYDFTFATTGGIGTLHFGMTGLPSNLSINPATGEVTGTPLTAGTYPVVLTVTDSAAGSATARYILSVQTPLLQITTTQLPNGTVGVPYGANISATGGQGSYTFSLSGSLPAGLSMSSSGAITGTPNKAGTTSFSVQVSDSAGNNVSAIYSITILVPPLTITNGPLGSVPQGSPLNLTFNGSGGNPGYTFSAGSGLPPGTSFSSSGVLSGSPTTQGSYTFQVTVKDSTGVSFSKSFTLTVVAPLVSILENSLPNGQVGVAYSSQLFATGGSTPYTFTITGAPPGLTMTTNGLLSGTPTSDGVFTPTVTVTDAVMDVTSVPYTVTIAPAPLVITTQTLPSGVAGTAYTTTLTATGGDQPYTWTAPGIPTGLTLSAAGTLSGTPASSGTYSITFTVTDSKKVTASVVLGLVINANGITITTASLPNGTVSSPYSATLAATGGAGSNQWAATNLPPGLTMSSSGTISGTPMAAGQFVTVVTVTDAAKTVAVQTYTISILLPTTPGLNFSSLPGNANPGTQSNVQIGLASAYPIPVTVTLNLTFTPDSGPDDPGVQFSAGGRSVTVSIPAGSTSPIGSAAVQFGTTAGTILITADLVAAGQDITPAPAPSVKIRVAPAAPVISSVTAVRGTGGFTVTVVGFATPRQVAQATFTFAAQGSANLQTTSLTVTTSSLFSSYYSSQAALPFGGQFSFVQTFNVTGSLAGITSVTVTLTDPSGTSTPATATLQ
ncbi:MAG TPA: putative Ig domain-containing protein [Verrucomicrobiae bacterium]|nr:putative Ig domain-containing protein [Verrucomicrobiae bacterium]